MRIFSESGKPRHYHSLIIVYNFIMHEDMTIIRNIPANVTKDGRYKDSRMVGVWRQKTKTNS